jgi:YHS domain-containing protein
MTLRATLVLAGILATVSPAAAGDYNTGYFGNVAIEGYDPVAYFTDNKGVPGDPAITAEYGGAIWHFASAEHRDLFVADPEAYAPQFGGLCAEGVAYGEISANLSPEVFQIVDGKLYLNYAVYWMDLEANIPIAQSKWEGVRALLAGN